MTKKKTVIFPPKYDLNLLNDIEKIAHERKRSLNNLILLWITERRNYYLDPFNQEKIKKMDEGDLGR